MTTKTKTRPPARVAFDAMPTDYGTLCRTVLLPRPIHDESAYEEAYAAIEPLIGREGRMSRDQEDWFDLISNLICDYQDERDQPLPKSKPLDSLRHLVEDAHGWTGADLARFLGLHPTMGPKILRGERKLTVEHIRKLAKKFQVSVEVLV